MPSFFLQRSCGTDEDGRDRKELPTLTVAARPYNTSTLRKSCFLLFASVCACVRDVHSHLHTDTISIPTCRPSAFEKPLGQF